jgi:copper chaperone
MYSFNVPDMTCGGCASSVKKALLSIDPTAQIETNPPARTVSVASDKPKAEFLAVLAKAGYPANEDTPQQGAEL